VKRVEGRQVAKANNGSRMKIVTVGMVLIGLIATTAVGSASAGQYLVQGVGNIKCTEFTGDSDENGAAYKEDQQWIVGFITGYNNALVTSSMDSNIGKGTDFDATMKLVYNYCTQYPDDELTDAAHGLMGYFKKGGS